jgi:hypothetical protein
MKGLINKMNGPAIARQHFSRGLTVAVFAVAALLCVTAGANAQHAPDAAEVSNTGGVRIAVADLNVAAVPGQSVRVSVSNPQVYLQDGSVQ